MLRVATRGSALARWQADHVAALLRARHPDLEVELVVVETSGDRVQDVPISVIGGQGVFVKEVQAAVLAGRADVAVHSAKDLPSTVAAGLRLGAFPARDDPRDALVGASLADLAPGATVATGSVRRRAQLAAVRPDLSLVELRGTIATRLAKVPSDGAIVVAVAALNRLQLAGRAAEILPPTVMLPQVAQGALAVECRDDDEVTVALLGTVDDPLVRAAVEAERAFLARLGTGCDLPVGAHAVVRAAGVGRDGPPSAADLATGRAEVAVEGLIASRDGRTVLRAARVGPLDLRAATGVALAEHLLDGGGAELLAAQP